MSGSAQGHGGLRRLALLLLAFALLLKIPAGWMPEASARGVSFGWCNAVSAEAAAEGKALLEAALGKPAPKQTPVADQTCSYAAAAQPMIAGDPAPVPMPAKAEAPAPVRPLAAIPGRGLAAPPPLSTGPPRLS